MRKALSTLPRAARTASLRPAAIARQQTRLLATAKEPSPNDIFASGTNAYYAEEMYKRWREDPKSVHASWDVYFAGLDKGIPSSQAFTQPPSHFDVPEAAGGAPSLDIKGSNGLTDHLKVCFISLSL